MAPGRGVRRRSPLSLSCLFLSWSPAHCGPGSRGTGAGPTLAVPVSQRTETAVPGGPGGTPGREILESHDPAPAARTPMSAPLNLINLERVSKAHGTTVLLEDVSLGVAAGERIGVVGRNGS